MCAMRNVCNEQLTNTHLPLRAHSFMCVEVSFADKSVTKVTRYGGVGTLVVPLVRVLAPPITALVQTAYLESIDLQFGSIVREGIGGIDWSAVHWTQSSARVHYRQDTVLTESMATRSLIGVGETTQTHWTSEIIWQSVYEHIIILNISGHHFYTHRERSIASFSSQSICLVCR